MKRTTFPHLITHRCGHQRRYWLRPGSVRIIAGLHALPCEDCGLLLLLVQEAYTRGYRAAAGAPVDVAGAPMRLEVLD